MQLVVSRYAADKKISSLPYTLWVTANDKKHDERPDGRAGAVSDDHDLGARRPQTPSYSYRDVGTNIDCLAASQADGTVQLSKSS